MSAKLLDILSLGIFSLDLVIVCPYKAVMQVGKERIGREKTDGRDQCRMKPTKMGAGSRQTVLGRSREGENIGEGLY